MTEKEAAAKLAHAGEETSPEAIAKAVEEAMAGGCPLDGAVRERVVGVLKAFTGRDGTETLPAAADAAGAKRPASAMASTSSATSSSSSAAAAASRAESPRPAANAAALNAAPPSSAAYSAAMLDMDNFDEDDPERGWC